MNSQLNPVIASMSALKFESNEGNFETLISDNLLTQICSETRNWYKNSKINMFISKIKIK